MFRPLTDAPQAPKAFRFLVAAALSIVLMFLGSQPASAIGTGPTFSSVSAGEHFTCGLTSTGDVYCWGENDHFQLGTSAVNSSSTPNQVYQISNVLQIASGRDFACARISDGGVACWGRADLGQTGDGLLSESDRYFATRVQGINTAIDISAGEGHACAVLKDKSVMCWGQNQYGQIGNEKNKNEKMPVKVEGIPNVIQVSAGQGHTCALGENGFIYCWGDNKYGQLGIGSTQVLKKTPSLVLGIQKVKSIQVGYNTSCAIKENSGIWCWGWGQDGQGGELDKVNRWLPELIGAVLITVNTSPVKIVPSVDFETISIGKTNVCGVLNSLRGNTLYCWGLNRFTDPGISTSTTFSTGTSVSIGDGHGCIVTTTGTISCWGWNHKGQLGLGLISNTFSTIAMVSGFPDWLYWITSWNISYENNLGTLSWTGGSGKYIISIQGLGILCEGRSTQSCVFGPLESNRKYVGTITAINSPAANNRTVNVEFTTGTLISEYDKYALDLAAAAKNKSELEKADKLILILLKQIEANESLISKTEAILSIQDKKNSILTDQMEIKSTKISQTSLEIRKQFDLLKASVAKIIKKIGN